MATDGNKALWAETFDPGQILKVLQLVLDSWRSFKIPLKLLEVPITRKFCAHLRNNRDKSIHFFRIDWESTELDDKGQELGRIDLKFSQGYDEKVCFSIECKRLRVNFDSGFDSLANEYVEDGMYRYFNGQYATGLDKGGMLGYVMDGEVNKAIENVRKAVEGRRLDLHMEQDGTLCNCSILASKQVKETFHNHGPENKFHIYHIFLPVKAA